MLLVLYEILFCNKQYRLFICMKLQTIGVAKWYISYWYPLMIQYQIRYVVELKWVTVINVDDVSFESTLSPQQVEWLHCTGHWRIVKKHVRNGYVFLCISFLSSVLLFALARFAVCGESLSLETEFTALTHLCCSRGMQLS